jgi:hypothetical protein
MRTFARKPKATQQTLSAKSTVPGQASFGQGHDLGFIRHLQRTMGNQAVRRLLEVNTRDAKKNLAATQDARFGHGFSRIPTHPSSAGPTQTIPAGNKPGDEFEREAERDSEQVMHKSEPSAQPPGKIAGEVATVQTRPVAEPPADIGQHAEAEEEDAIRQAKEAKGCTPEVERNTQAQFAAMRGGGQLLPKSVRAFFEPRFGYDLALPLQR